MKKLKLAVLPGDGIGRDVTFAALPIFETLHIPVEIAFADIGWECWVKNGNPIPQKTWEIIQASDAVLLGATTSMPEKEAIKALPKTMQASPPRYISPIVQLRQQLDLYANVRPCFNIKGQGEYFNFAVIRENTEGLYAGLDFYPLPGKLQSLISKNPRWRDLSSSDASCTLRLQSRNGLLRLFQFAFEYAKREKFNRVTFADKPNVLRKSSAFARELFEEVAKKYPDIKSEIHNVDAVALWIVKRPQEFGVIVAENMFGDILSDLGAGVMGGLGLAPSANMGAKGCYFEPVHGSAPRVQENCANPSAMFLTIAMLLKHFGYHNESNIITKAVKSVVKNDDCVTYDLGGSATTKEMAQAIITQCIFPAEKKAISFLATGSEIIQGDIQDTNSNFFAKIISDNGGNIYQHIQTSDVKNEIGFALQYLLNKSDAVIVCGGLGPTSDDVTRFAIADITKKELIFDETAWAHIVKRQSGFNLPVSESNRQQALFPIGAELYPNEHGTAFGCYLKWENKHIFMLPGPPKECRILFEKYIVPTLEKNNFFRKKKICRWLTMGLIEGEIATQIDKIAKPYPVETAYRWNYPYLEIKILTPEKENIASLIHDIEKILLPYVVSTNQKNAFEMLHEALSFLGEDIYVIDNATRGEFIKNIHNNNLHYIENNTELKEASILFSIKSSHDFQNQTEFSGVIVLECEGFIENKKHYKHSISIPNRSADVIHYAECYIAWQIRQFITYYKESL